MKKILLVTFIMISQINFGQITKKLADFSKVTTFDQIDVRLIQGTENKILLSGNGADEVELINKNGELKIRMPLSKTMLGDAISATVYFIKIDALEANEGSRISSEVIFEGLNFNIIAKEGAEIKLLLNVDSVTIKISSGATVILEGSAKNQDGLCNSGGHLVAKELVTFQTIITANTGGEATVYAVDFVDAKVRAGGEIVIYGNPKRVNQKTILGGTIVRK